MLTTKLNQARLTTIKPVVSINYAYNQESIVAPRLKFHNAEVGSGT